MLKIMGSRLAMLAAVLSVAGATSSAAGCWNANRVDLYTCDDPCGNGQPGRTCDNPCGSCVGQCIPIPPLKFDGPMIVYIGPEQGAPECPAHAPINAYEGFGDLRDESLHCPPCKCSEPACVLPEGVTASPQACPGGGATTSVDAPNGWEGECTSPTTVSNLGSVTIAPVTVRPCEPIVEVVPNWEVYPLWNTFARACRGQVDNGRCGDPGLICMLTAEPPPPGFQQCIAAQAELGQDLTCPDTYPFKFTFYSGADDTRDCTECACQQQGQPNCTGWVSLHQGADCSSAIYSSMVADQAICSDVPGGIQLRSMEASWLVDDPGTCMPTGGVAVGEVVPKGPTIFCCQPPP